MHVVMCMLAMLNFRIYRDDTVYDGEVFSASKTFATTLSGQPTITTNGLSTLEQTKDI
jgi:hypothetical protein